MVIKLDLESTEIPVILGDLEFSFDVSDDALQKIASTGEKFGEEMSKIQGDDIEATKEALKRSFDFLLGPSTFDQIYERMPSVTKCMSLLEKLINLLTEGLDAQGIKPTQQQKADHYLKQKKKKKSKK